MQFTQLPATPAGSPFDPDNRAAYLRWRDAKLASAPRALEALVVAVRDPAALSDEELYALRGACRAANLAIFDTGRPFADGAALQAFGAQLGLRRLDVNLCAEEDGVSALSVRPRGQQADYIPYTDRPLSWHTDGYYNAAGRQIRSWILYCVRQAAEGGGNALLDHEMAYLLMRDHNPDYVRVLMAPDAMTIPANTKGTREIRPVSTGPVFSVDPGTGTLHMRYSARQRNVLWKPDRLTEEARRWLERLLSDPSAPIYEYRLGPGQGILSNNVLHRRQGFRDAPETGETRLLLRARYYDRIAATDGPPPCSS